jgi:phosphoribosyl-dephospho-CoA transferase
MKESELCQGMKVRIVSLFNTKQTHSVNNDMLNMFKKEYTIESVIEETDHGIAAQIKNFWWHPGDLVSLEKPLPSAMKQSAMKQKVVNFNIKELVL